MTTTTHIIIVDPAEETRSDMAMAALDADEPWLGHDSLPEVAQAIDSGLVPAVVLVGPGVVHDDAISLAESIQDEQLPARLIQFAKVLDPDRLRDALRAGVADVVEVRADPVEVRSSVARVRRDLAGSAVRAPLVAATQPTPVVAVMGSKGGVGTSLITTNVATALSGRGIRVGLIDLDVASGDLAIMLQKRPALTILDAIDRVDHLDLDALSGYLTQVKTNLHLLPAPLEGGEAHVPTGQFMRLLGLVQDSSDVVLVDLGMAADSTARAVLAEAREALVVATREVTAIRGTLRLLAELEAIGLRGEAVRVIVNQSTASTGLSIDDLEKAIKRGVSTAVPSDKFAARSVNQGEPLVNRRRSKAGRALEAVADHLAETHGLVAVHK